MTIKTAVVLFGMPRHVPSFLSSFERNILKPLERLNSRTNVMGALNVPTTVLNPRSGEQGIIERPESISERFPDVTLLPQQDLSHSKEFAYFRTFPDRWKDDYRSVSNLLHQQHSLWAGTEQALEAKPDLFIFLRPDLTYLDSFDGLFDRILKRNKREIYTPAWLTCRGLNDRIAITTSPEAARIYGTRMSKARDFTETYGTGLHSERLLAFTLGSSRVPNRFFTQRAARVRIDGNVVAEDFTIKWRVKARTQARLILAPKTYAR